MKLTDSTLAKLLGKKSGKTADLIVFDDDLPGFGLRIRASGSRTWIFQYKLGPQHRQITSGNIPRCIQAKPARPRPSFTPRCGCGNDPAAIKSRKAKECGGDLWRCPEKLSSPPPGTGS